MKSGFFGLAFLFLATLWSCQKVSQSRASTIDIEDKRWTLLALPSSKIPVDSSIANKIHFKLHKTDQKLTAFGGCNAMGGQYSLKENSLTFTKVFQTEMYCEEKMEIERAFSKVFAGVVFWEISDKQELIILNQQKEVVGKFINIK